MYNSIKMDAYEKITAIMTDPPAAAPIVMNDRTGADERVITINTN